MEREIRQFILVLLVLALVLGWWVNLPAIIPGVENAWGAIEAPAANLAWFKGRCFEGRPLVEAARYLVHELAVKLEAGPAPSALAANALVAGAVVLRPAGARFTPGSNLLAAARIIRDMDVPLNSRPAARDSETDLVIAATAGDRAAYAALYRKHAGWLLPTLWRLTGGDRHRAEDLLQDAFVQAWNKLGQLREPAAFGGWLKRLAVNLALADRRRMHLVDNQAVPEPSAPEPPWPAADLDLERAVAALPERARQVLVLFHLEGLGHEEIAAAMNIEPGTSKAQLHRARSLLKEMLA